MTKRKFTFGFKTPSSRPKKLMSSFFMPLYLIGFCLVIAGYMFWQRDYFFPPREEASLRISVLLDSESGYANSIMREGMNQAAFDYNCELTFRAPLTSGSYEEQQRLLENELADPPQGIAVAPINEGKIMPVLKEAGSRMKLMLINAETEDSGLPNVGTDYKKMGTYLAQQVALHHENMPDVRIFYTDGANSSISRIEKGFSETWRKAGGRITTERILGHKVNAEYLAREMEDDRLSLWLALDANALETLAKAKRLLSSSLLKPPLYGRGNSPSNVDGIRDGTIQGMLVENSYNSGYLAIARLADAIRGNRNIKSETLRFYLITRDNVSSHESELLLFPIIQ